MFFTATTIGTGPFFPALRLDGGGPLFVCKAKGYATEEEALTVSSDALSDLDHVIKMAFKVKAYEAVVS